MSWWDLVGTAVTYLPLVSSLVAWRPTSCQCVFTHETSPLSTDLIALLSRQLDRCGPEHLVTPACPNCPGDRSEFFLLLGFGLGILLSLGVWLSFWWARSGAAHPDHKDSSGSSSAQPRGPSGEHTPDTLGRARRPPRAIGDASP